jgi:signal transduction histidine kinase
MGMIWHTKTLQENVVKSSGLHNAEHYSDVITTFRTLYTSEVVAAAEQHGLQVTHDYLNKKAIPLPATLSILLGNKIGGNDSGAKVSLYSPHPFPWRTDTGGLKDDFSKKAWAHLSKNSNEPFFEFYIDNNKNFLRYAVADKMRESCIHCHNTHPDSPKIDWKAGDLRGILDVTIPLDKILAKTGSDLLFTIIIYSLLAFLGVIGVIFMIAKHKTESEKLEDAVKIRTAQLEQEKIKAIKASQAKTEFLSRMSHELRTPMNAILGFSQLLEMDASTDAEKETCREILTAGNHLLELINEVLDLAKIESGKFSTNIVSVPVDKTINEVLKLFTSIAGNKGVHIDNYNPAGFYVHADPTRLKQVMVNLISNAIKYNCDNGRVEVNVTYKEPNAIRISVRDTGHGLNASQQQSLFQPFERINAENNGIDGVGIGLAISKILVEAMDGRIGVESAPDKGSTFWIELKPVIEK